MNMNRRHRFFRRLLQGLLLVISLCLLAVFYVRDIEPNWIEIRTVQMPLPHLAPEFSGYRIVQLSDIHADRWMTANRLAKVVHRVNDLHPDLVVLTGDYVTHFAENYVSHLRVLKDLRPADETLAVLGNHDVWTNPMLVQQTLEAANVKVLNNQVETLQRQSAQLHVGGVDDIWANRDRLDQVLAAILLAHEPDFADQSAATGRFDLQLSGHSHGGQVSLPFRKRTLPPLAYHYPIGQYKVGAMIQYTNRGVGVSGLRLRFNCRPEITVFTLTTVS
jgi:uncharacterized protein